MSKQVFDTDFVSLPAIDSDLATCYNMFEIDWSKTGKDLLAEERNDDNESDGDDELNETESEKCITINIALSYCDQINILVEKEFNFELLGAIMSTRDISSKLIAEKCSKKPKFSDFFV
ncbi:hypothetical protein SNE40_019417 [Patella caerulea]|uniref:Uncharacterized protein n=1 Tax=Patella caerulea TaxID=87958 RepID=A0AAN8JB37_PATCE